MASSTFSPWLFSVLFHSLIVPTISANIPRRQIPADPSGVVTISSPGGVQVRYKEPGICETTPGVKSYSGYVDVDASTHIFFWFFEARENPSEAPTTLWLTGGPGDDSLLATFFGEFTFILHHLQKLILEREWPMSHHSRSRFRYSVQSILMDQCL